MQYPSRLEDVFYGLQKQEPSYRSDFPSDFPFDPGTTSSLFELNYFPTTSSWLLFLMPVVIVLLLVLFHRRIKFNVGAMGLLVAMAIVFLGPLRLPPLFLFNTSLGLVKGIGLLLLLYVCIRHIFRRVPFDFFAAPSFLPLVSFIISLMLSVFVMTNPDFFLQDFGIFATGILFYYLGFMLFTWKETQRLIHAWAYLLLIPSGLVLLIFVSRGIGVQLMSFLFQRYENFVFLHDLLRGRIFSVIDFEYFTPCLVYLSLLTIKRKKFGNSLATILLTSASFIAILLVNYRYRFLTYVLGFILMFFFLKEYRKKILATLGWVFVGLFTLYMGASIVFYRGTIIDRFLLRDYYEDAVSVQRRLVMYQQAWELFLEKPLLGVGLGNYKDNVQIVYSRFGGRTYEPYYKILQNVYAYPHNWYLTVLAEDGTIGFVVLLWLLYTFAAIDIRLWKNIKDEKLRLFATLSSISWLYLFANLFTMMHVSLPMVIVFWACRGMIERIYIERFRARRAISERGVPRLALAG